VGIKRTISQEIEDKLKDILAYIGEDVKREGLIETPYRIVKSWDKLYGGYNQNATETIILAVNRTSNDVPSVKAISYQETSINLATMINISAYDDDLLIPDKNETFNGYNETLNISRKILVLVDALMLICEVLTTGTYLAK